MCNGIALVLGEPRHARAFGDVLADESIGILVAAPLPGVMRGSEVEGNAGLMKKKVTDLFLRHRILR